MCGSQWVVVHFYHRSSSAVRSSTSTCAKSPKHLVQVAHPRRREGALFRCEAGNPDASDSIVFKDGIVHDQFSGFDEMGGKDEFRTEVMEHWFSKAGCVVMKKSVKKMNEDSDEENESDDDDWH